MLQQSSARSSRSRSILILLLVLVVSSGVVTVYFLYPLRTSEARHVTEGGAAIVDALSDLSPNPDFETRAVEYLEQAGMYVDIYRSPNVTVNFMKSFPAGYSLVVFRVHSGTSRRGVFYFTSEPYDEAKYQPEQYREELRPAKDYEGHHEVFAFGAKFVDTYLQGRFPNAIIVGMGCFGAGTSHGTEEEVVIEDVPLEKGPNLADSFLRQGASAIVGWDKLVTLSFSDQASLRLIKALALDRLTVAQAVRQTNQELGPDPIYKSKLEFYPEENGDGILQTPSRQDETVEVALLLLPEAQRFADSASTASSRARISYLLLLSGDSASVPP